MVAGLLVSGCLFDTRDAEPPGGEGSTWVVPTVPSRVFTNLKSGLEELTGTNYVRSLHDDFSFIPLPEDESQFPPGWFVGWNRDTEVQVVERMVAESNEISVRFISPQQITDQASFAEFRADYELIMDKPALAEPDTFQGFAEFDMVNGSKGWQLILWEDLERRSGFATWGRVRGELKP